jgi:flagellar motor switch protein FliG
MLILASLLSLPARAAEPNEEAERLKSELRSQASLLANEILRTHCGDRCSLVDVKAEVDIGQPLAHVQPGFEELSPQVREVKPRSIELAVLLDGRLPADFRRDLVGLLKAKLKSLPATAIIKADVVPFPQPLMPQMPPTFDSRPAPSPTPTPEVKPSPTPTPEMKPAPFDPMQALLERLISAAPWLLGLILLAATILLLVRMLRPPAEESDEDETPAPRTETGKSERATANEQPVPLLAQRINDELRANPRLRTTLFKEIFTADESKAAQCVRLLGPHVADGLREDPACREALRRISTELRSGNVTVSDEEARKLLKELEGRLTAARLEGVGSAAEDTFAFLDRLTPAQFLRLLEEVSPRAQSTALRFAPAHLRENALASLEPTKRRTLFLAAADAGAAGAQELSAIADELLFQVSRLAPGHDMTGVELLTDLLESQGPHEQKALLDSLAAKPAIRQALLARLCTETTLLRMDEDALAVAVSAVDVNALVDFLRGADSALKERMLSVCPRPMADALREELGLAVTQNPAQFLAARKQVMQAARQVLQQRGTPIEQLNGGEVRRAAG